MIYTHGMFPTRKLEAGDDDGFTLLVAAGYARTISPGCIALLPLGLRVLEKITRAIVAIAEAADFSRMALPLLQRRELWAASHRDKKYADYLCVTRAGSNRFVINPTQEEAVLDLFRSTNLGTNDLPLRVFQVSERVRNEIRPAFGLIRSRCFVLADLYVLCSNKEEMDAATLVLDRIMKEVFRFAGLPHSSVPKFPRVAASTASSHWVPSVTKQCIIPHCDNCGVSFCSREAPEVCPHCSYHTIASIDAVEIGDVIQSGTDVSGPMSVAPADAKELLHVALAGIGVSRLLQLMAEYHHDARGLTWRPRMAPYLIEVLADDKRTEEARLLYATLTRLGYEVMLDERPYTLGRRLVDADLFGIPLRVMLGKRTQPGMAEFKERKTGVVTPVPLNAIPQLVQQFLFLESSNEKTE